MQKKESTFRNMVISLFIVTLIASLSLGLVYELTEEPIAAAKLKKKKKAIREVLPEFNNDPFKEVYAIPVDNDTLRLYPVKMNDKYIGTAVETFTKNGFSGTIRLMVGFRDDGTINNIIVLEHKETAGLGDKIEKSKSFSKKTGKSWSSQFLNQDPKTFNLKVKNDGGEVDAITAATITSRAYCDAIDKAYHALQEQ